MTITVSSDLEDLIIMLSDSVITEELNQGESTTYHSERKFCTYPGIGCVTTWGRRGGNRIEDYLDRQRLSVGTHSAEDLAKLTYRYLKEEFRPHDFEDPDEVGYHVGGFDRKVSPVCFTAFGERTDPPSPSTKRQITTTMTIVTRISCTMAVTT